MLSHLPTLHLLHRMLLAAMLVCLAAPAAAQTNKTIRKLQSEQSSLKKKITEQENMLRSTKKDVSAQLANLQVLTAQIEGQQKYVEGIHSELTMLAGSIGELEAQLRLLEADLNECKRQYRRAMNYMFRNRLNTSKLQFILSAPNFRQMYRRMRYISNFSKYQQAQGRLIQQKEKEVQDKRAELLGQKTQKDRLFVQGQAEKRKLEGQQQQRRQAVDELNAKQKQLQASIAQQRKKYSQLNARIDKLIQEEIAAAERRRKAEEERRRKAEAARQARLKAEREAAERNNRTTASAKGKGSTTTAKGKKNDYDAKTATPRFNEADNADRALSGSFAANRGRLPMPVTGPYAITAHFGSYNVEGLHGVQLDNKGINITAHPGAQARAVFKGEVTAVFAYGGLYNVIVRHGSYMTVYCNLASTCVHRGQQVQARQSLGAIARDASGNCTLHFQLRKETAKLNPEAWLAR